MKKKVKFVDKSAQESKQHLAESYFVKLNAAETKEKLYEMFVESPAMILGNQMPKDDDYLYFPYKTDWSLEEKVYFDLITKHKSELMATQSHVPVFKDSPGSVSINHVTLQMGTLKLLLMYIAYLRHHQGSVPSMNVTYLGLKVQSLQTELTATKAKLIKATDVADDATAELAQLEVKLKEAHKDIETLLFHQGASKPTYPGPDDEIFEVTSVEDGGDFNAVIKVVPAYDKDSPFAQRLLLQAGNLPGLFGEKGGWVSYEGMYYYVPPHPYYHNTQTVVSEPGVQPDPSKTLAATEDLPNIGDEVWNISQYPNSVVGVDEFTGGLTLNTGLIPSGLVYPIDKEPFKAKGFAGWVKYNQSLYKVPLISSLDTKVTAVPVKGVVFKPSGAILGKDKWGNDTTMAFAFDLKYLDVDTNWDVSDLPHPKEVDDVAVTSEGDSSKGSEDFKALEENQDDDE